jgi:hypothetical protein
MIALRQSFRENSPILFIVTGHALAAISVYQIFNLPKWPYDGLWLNYVGFVGTMAISLFVAFAIWFIYLKRVRRVPDFHIVLVNALRNDFFRRERLILAIPILLFWPAFASAFSFLKSAIVVMRPFYLDAWLSRWDRLLHFGVDPWRLLQPILGHAPITFAINWNYTLWFLVLHVTVALQAFSVSDRRLRLQFLTAMVLAWALLGNLAAALMSSAGPCYFGKVTSLPDVYAPLMTYLRDVSDHVRFSFFGTEIHVPITALLMQDFLWQGYAEKASGIGQGISAAPSLHIGSSWLIARLCAKLGKGFAIAGILFLVLMFVGSVHLGWHYAIDGYLGILGAWALWRATGWFLDRARVKSALWPDLSPQISVSHERA